MSNSGTLKRILASHSGGREADSGRVGQRTIVHENSATDQVLRNLRAPGAAVGRHILVDSALPGQFRGQVLRHELRHASQTGFRDPDPSFPILVGRVDSPLEVDARRAGAAPAVGADPNVLRRFSPDGEEDQCVLPPEPEGGQNQSVLPEIGSSDSNSASSLDSSSEPPPAGDEPNTCEIQANTCELPTENETGFNPDRINVAELRNDELNAESIFVDQWFKDHADISHIDEQGYRTYRSRLRAERTNRVRQGHLWLTTALATHPDELYMIMPGGNQRIIVSVDLELAFDTPRQSYPAPIMTVTQFREQIGASDLPMMSEQEYLELVTENFTRIREEMEVEERWEQASLAPLPGEGFAAPGFHGYVGGLPQIDYRASGIAQALRNRNTAGRIGDLSEVFFTSDRSNWYGYRGKNYNATRRRWSGDWLRPLYTPRGNEPVADFRGHSSSPFDDLSIKATVPDTQASRNPNERVRMRNLLEGHRTMIDTGGRKFQLFMDQSARGRTPADVQSGMMMAIPEDLYDEYTRMLMDTHGRVHTDTGNEARKPNYDIRELKAIYDLTVLPPPFPLDNRGTPLRTGAEIRAAFDAELIDATQFRTYMDIVGRQAASRVRPIPGWNADVARWYLGFDETIPLQRNVDYQAAVSPEQAMALEYQRLAQQSQDPSAPYSPRGYGRATARVARTQGVRGGAVGGGAAIAFDYFLNENADYSDPRYRRHAAELFVSETARSGISEAGEAGARAWGGQYIMQQGLGRSSAKAVAIRLGSRAVPGVVDVVWEGGSMLTDNRDNSAAEVTVRTTRAAVIGTGSAWAGAAIGTAIGGPIGFVVGLGVGAAVGWIANTLIPGGRAYWERRAEEQRLLRGIEEKISRIEAILEERERARRRLDTPLSSEAASSVGMDAIPYEMIQDDVFRTSSPESEQLTVGELEAEYVRAIMRGDQD